MVNFDNNNDENEVVIDPELPPDDLDLELEEGSLKDKVSDLRKKIKVCEEVKRSILEDLQRTKADFLNSRKRLEEQLERDKERAVDKIILELLSLSDSFETAMADKEQWSTVDEKWRSGVNAIYTKLTSILKMNNLEVIDPEGKPFNPHEHDAVSNSTVEDDEQIDTVVTVLQKGFKRNSVVIRPARVVVGTK